MAYRRLLPRESNVFSYAELWAEDDHLLSVKSYRLNVHYQRFPLAEIQAISVTTLPHWTLPQIGWLFGSGLLFGVSVLATGVFLGLFFGFLTVWPFVLAIREMVRGPRCRTCLHTVTGAHELPAVSRQSQVEEFLAIVTSRIEEVQGRVDRLEVTERPVEHPEDAARGVLTRDRGLRLFAFTTLLLEGLFALALWRWPRLDDRLEMNILSLSFYVSVLFVILTVWNRSTPLLRRDRVYILAAVTLALALAELAFVILWMATLGVGGLSELDRWGNLGGAVWRIPLALTALTIDLRRK